MITMPGWFCRAKILRRTSAVNISQPFLEWEPGLWARTVKLVFNQRTPSSATRLRSLWGRCYFVMMQTTINPPWTWWFETRYILGKLLVDIPKRARWFGWGEDRKWKPWRTVKRYKDDSQNNCIISNETYHALDRCYGKDPIKNQWVSLWWSSWVTNLTQNDHLYLVKGGEPGPKVDLFHLNWNAINRKRPRWWCEVLTGRVYRVRFIFLE